MPGFKIETVGFGVGHYQTPLTAMSAYAYPVRRKRLP